MAITILVIQVLGFGLFMGAKLQNEYIKENQQKECELKNKTEQAPVASPSNNINTINKDKPEKLPKIIG